MGRGKYSYLVYNNKKILLRSTYEFIFALYLLYKGIEFEYETVRAPAITKNNYAETFISDFLIITTNTIVEVKGVKSGKDVYTREAFIALGYNYEIKYLKDIKEYKKFLSTKLDINYILKLICIGHNTKNYYTYVFN